MSEVVKESRVTQSSTTVQAVSEAVAEAGQVPVLTAKQKERQAKKEREYWNGMVSRDELSKILQEHSQNMEQKLQILYVQNATLLEVFKVKGLIVDEDMVNASKKVMEELFGIMPEAEAPVVPATPES